MSALSVPAKPLPNSNQLSSYQLPGELALSFNCLKKILLEDAAGMDDVAVVVALLGVLVVSSEVLVAMFTVLVVSAVDVGVDVDVNVAVDVAAVSESALTLEGITETPPEKI